NALDRGVRREGRRPGRRAEDEHVVGRRDQAEADDGYDGEVREERPEPEGGGGGEPARAGDTALDRLRLAEGHIHRGWIIDAVAAQPMHSAVPMAELGFSADAVTALLFSITC